MPRGKVRNPPHRTGQPPKDATLLASREDGWSVFSYRVGESSKGHKWVNAKIISTVPRPAKANYWVSYNVTLLDYGKTRDLFLLEDKCPDVALWAERAIIAFYGGETQAGVAELDTVTNLEDLM